ncbi:MAG: hypothetical protein WA118_00070 [Carboxydocellales bacterium]
MLSAGLDGIKHKLLPPAPTNRNIYEMSKAEREEAGIASLPGSLKEAIAELIKDEVIKNALGEHILSKYVEAKETEWDSYRTKVHQWELDQYIARY